MGCSSVSYPAPAKARTTRSRARRPLPRLRRLIEFRGVEHLQAALDKGRGALMLSAHFTTLEIGARMLTARGLGGGAPAERAARGYERRRASRDPRTRGITAAAAEAAVVVAVEVETISTVVATMNGTC